MNLDVFNNIDFYEEEHKYKFLDHPELTPTSVTGVIGNYKEPFKADFFAQRKADSLGITKEDVLEEWRLKGDFASKKGTLVHLYMEMMMCNEPFKIPYELRDPDVVKAFNDTKPQCDKFLKDSKKALRHIASEQIVGCPEWNITGMIDEIVQNTETGEYYLFDWKTNKEIKKKVPYKLLNSLSHLDSSEMTIYSLQLGLYKRIIEKYVDIKISKCYICHIPSNGEPYKIYKTRNYEKEIDTILMEYVWKDQYKGEVT